MKAKTCNWCGERIGPDDIRVKLPIKNTDSAFTYHADCYVRVYDRRCLRVLLSDDYPHGIMAWARRSAILDALDTEALEQRMTWMENREQLRGNTYPPYKPVVVNPFLRDASGTASGTPARARVGTVYFDPETNEYVMPPDFAGDDELRWKADVSQMGNFPAAGNIDKVPTVCCAECEYGPPPADAVGAPTACLHCFCGDNFERRQP